MSEVEIRVNGREYKVTCEEGQEERLQRIAAYFDKRVTNMVDDLGQIGDARLMLLSALTICDELFEARETAQDYENAGDALDPETVGGASRAIEAAAHRVSEMAARLEDA
ncbi:cell division protein ZapA [Hyphococcus sp.]|uniref:cell division protein ZapA n=1 Tax=Hyphococcus sp. TaxID=2038636 RepID=UPI003CCC3A7D